MDRISSAAFFKAWMGTIGNRKDHMLGIWRQARPFTAYVKGNEESIMQEVATKLGLLCYHSDYYSIDTVLYKVEDLAPGIPEGSCWLKDIRVAFEHENSFNRDLYKEVAHLLITDCDLRVLVTYPNRDTGPILDYLHCIISSKRKAATISQEGSFLIIFGYEADFRWEGRVYNSEGWMEI